MKTVLLAKAGSKVRVERIKKRKERVTGEALQTPPGRQSVLECVCRFSSTRVACLEGLVHLYSVRQENTYLVWITCVRENRLLISR